MYGSENFSRLSDPIIEVNKGGSTGKIASCLAIQRIDTLGFS